MNFYSFANLLAHEHGEHEFMQKGVSTYGKWIQWIGQFHPIFLHFPIALIVMTTLAEIISLKSTSLIYSQAARFMIIAAAVTAVPTAILGLALSYKVVYEDPLIHVLWWHRFLGISTTFLAIITAILKELNVRNKIGKKAYLLLLVVTLISITVTGYFGGEMTFGSFHWSLKKTP